MHTNFGFTGLQDIFISMLYEGCLFQQHKYKQRVAVLRLYTSLCAICAIHPIDIFAQRLFVKQCISYKKESVNKKY